MPPNVLPGAQVRIMCRPTDWRPVCYREQAYEPPRKFVRRKPLDVTNLCSRGCCEATARKSRYMPLNWG
jgi:hypothetical protein